MLRLIYKKVLRKDRSLDGSEAHFVRFEGLRKG